MVVLDVTGAALRLVRRDRIEHRRPFELREDRLVRASQTVGEHVQATAVGHPDHNLLRAVGGGEADHLVEHRHGHIDALDRKLMLTEVGLVHEALERVDFDEALEQRAPLVIPERLPKRAALDLLSQPGALTVRADVLDLEGDRAAVDLLQVRVGLGERPPGNVDLEDPGRDLRHQLWRQAERAGVQRRVSDRRRAERVELRRQVPVRAVRSHERDGGLNGGEQLLARSGGAAGCGEAALPESARGARAQRREDSLIERVGAAQQ